MDMTPRRDRGSAGSASPQCHRCVKTTQDRARPDGTGSLATRNMASMTTTECQKPESKWRSCCRRVQGCAVGASLFGGAIRPPCWLPRACTRHPQICQLWPQDRHPALYAVDAAHKTAEPSKAGSDACWTCGCARARPAWRSFRGRCPGTKATHIDESSRRLDKYPVGPVARVPWRGPASRASTGGRPFARHLDIGSVIQADGILDSRNSPASLDRRSTATASPVWGAQGAKKIVPRVRLGIATSACFPRSLNEGVPQAAITIRFSACKVQESRRKAKG